MKIQKGLRLCLKNCVDNLDNAETRRADMIAHKLATTGGRQGELVDQRPLQFAFYKPDRLEF